MRKNFLREREQNGKGGSVQQARAAIFCAFLTELTACAPWVHRVKWRKHRRLLSKGG